MQHLNYFILFLQIVSLCSHRSNAVLWLLSSLKASQCLFIPFQVWHFLTSSKTINLNTWEWFNCVLKGWFICFRPSKWAIMVSSLRVWIKNELSAADELWVLCLDAVFARDETSLRIYVRACAERSWPNHIQFHCIQILVLIGLGNKIFSKLTATEDPIWLKH